MSDLQYSANFEIPKSVLRAEGLNKSFRKKQAVRDVSFSMAQGEVVGLLGPNGAGKTTSFYMIVGFYVPNSGGIYLDDRRITDLPMYKRARIGISYLPQEASVFRKLSVEQNIDAILETRKDLSLRNEKKNLIHYWKNSESLPIGNNLLILFQAGNADVPKLHGRWLSNLSFYCLTNRLPVLILLPCTI